MSKELLLKSVRELSNNCDNWSRPVRWPWAESTRTSVGDCGWRLTVVSNGICCGNWTTVSPCCINQDSLKILGERLVNQDTQRIAPDDGVVVLCLKPETIAYVVPPGGVITGASGLLIMVDVVRFCVCKSSFLILINCSRRNNKITNK